MRERQERRAVVATLSTRRPQAKRSVWRDGLFKYRLQELLLSAQGLHVVLMVCIGQYVLF